MKMIGLEVKQRIEGFYQDINQRNALYLNARHGALTPRSVRHYLYNVRFLVQHTPVLLKLAQERAAAQEMIALAAYYEQKRYDEFGHDKWAEDGLDLLAPDSWRDDDDLAIAPELRHLLDFLRATISEAPVAYLAYIMLAEHLTVIGAPNLVRDLEQQCRIPATMMTVLTNHVELDKAHVDSGIAEMNALVDPDSEALIRRTLTQSMGFLERFLHAVGSVT